MPASESTSRQAALQRLKTAMIEKKLTQAELADAADCHEKTIQNLLNGRSVRDQTLFDVCMVLGLDFDDLKSQWSGETREVMAIDAPSRAVGSGGEVAPLYMGAYTRAAVEDYLGAYLTLRPSFGQPGVVVAYRTDITWDPGWPSLLFEERDRPDADYSHRGRLYIPAATNFIHLVSLTKGSLRTILVSQLDLTGHMRGLITTVNKQAALLVPVSTPIVYVRRDRIEQDTFGEFAPSHPRHATYAAIVHEATSQGYAKLIAG